MAFGGILLGAATFLCIGAFHPLVIHAEYRWGRRCWWAFSFFWSILEVFEQEKRVLKGWFPENPKRKEYYAAKRPAFLAKMAKKNR